MDKIRVNMKMLLVVIIVPIITVFPFSVFANINEQDITAPELVELSYSPTTINISSGSQDVTFTLKITDDLAGFDYGRIALKSPSGQRQYCFVRPTHLISGNVLDGVYEASTTFPQFIEGGTWVIQYVRLDDAIDNRGQRGQVYF